MDIYKSGDFSKIEYWNSRWLMQDTPWHKFNISSTLLEFFHPTITKLIKPIRVLIPLCGKSLDIKWLASEGIDVVGIEGCSKIIEEFFKDNNLNFQTTKYMDSVLYKCESLPISIFQCDIFNFDYTKLGKFNVIFDQGSLIAIDPKDRLKLFIFFDIKNYIKFWYRDIMKSFLMEDFQYILDSLTYGPPGTFNGPPHSFTFKEVQDLYPDFYCEILKERDAIESGKKISNNFEYFNFIAIIISPNHLAAINTSSLYYWNKRLADKDTPWHKVEVHGTLLERFKGLIDNLKNPVRAFVPLCGKSHDIKWIAEQGISVTGVEGSKNSIDEFFAEHSLPFKVDEIKDGILKYACQSIPLTIYKCNFFRIAEFFKEKFSFIWDRGSLVAIDPDDRKRYVKVMHSLLDKDFEYLLEAIVYEPAGVHKGAPNSITHDEVVQLFGDYYNCEILMTKDDLERGKQICDKFEHFTYNTTRISPKK